MYIRDMKLPLGMKKLNNVCRNETIFNPQRASQLYWNGKENKNISFICFAIEKDGMRKENNHKCMIVYAKHYMIVGRRDDVTEIQKKHDIIYIKSL